MELAFEHAAVVTDEALFGSHALTRFISGS